jgi:hypothetical protein
MTLPITGITSHHTALRAGTEGVKDDILQAAAKDT